MGSYGMSARERSVGMSTTTGPGRPVRAMWNASWIARGISRASWTMIGMPIASETAR